VSETLICNSTLEKNENLLDAMIVFYEILGR